MSREKYVGFVIHQMDNLVNRTRVALGLKTGVDEMTTVIFSREIWSGSFLLPNLPLPAS